MLRIKNEKLVSAALVIFLTISLLVEIYFKLKLFNREGMGFTRINTVLFLLFFVLNLLIISKYNTSRILKEYVLLIFIFLIIYTFIGLLNNEFVIPYYLFRDITAFLTILFFFSIQMLNFEIILKKIIIIQTILGLIIFISLIFSSGMDLLNFGGTYTRFLYYSTDMPLARSYLLFSPFLLISYKSNKFDKILALIAIVSLFYLTLVSQTRTYLLQIIILIFIIYKRMFTRNIYSRLFFLGVGFTFFYLIKNYLYLAFQGFKDRTIGLEQNSTIEYDSGRFKEAQIAFEEFNFFDWIVGKGFGGWWSSHEIYDGGTREILHIGFFNLIFKVGVLVGGVIVLSMLFFFVYYFFKMKNTTLIVYGFIPILIIVTSFSLFPFTASVNTILFWMSLGILMKKTIENRNYSNFN